MLLEVLHVYYVYMYVYIITHLRRINHALNHIAKALPHGDLFNAYQIYSKSPEMCNVVYMRIGFYICTANQLR